MSLLMNPLKILFFFFNDTATTEIYPFSLHDALPISPYLVQLDREDRFTHYAIEQGWGNAWGIFLRTETSMKALRRHLRGLLRVRDESGRGLIFRDRKSTRLNSSHSQISYAVFCLKNK